MPTQPENKAAIVKRIVGCRVSDLRTAAAEHARNLRAAADRIERTLAQPDLPSALASLAWDLRQTDPGMAARAESLHGIWHEIVNLAIED